MPHFQASGKDFSAPKIQFEIQIFLFNLTIHCCTPKIGKTYGCIGKLEKKFLAYFGSKYFHRKIGLNWPLTAILGSLI